MNTVPMKKEDLRAASPAMGASSEATLVEQQRAIAQVQGALVVAQQRPRDELAARDRMEAVCTLQTLAEHAFFRYSRGGSQISGPSVHLARELARCWGNIDYGISELRRDDRKGESEMLAYAWDLETNCRIVNSFIVPHKRDKRGGPEALTDMRDIYENNANAAARRLRECIFACLPKSYVEAAKQLCLDTLENGEGEPIEQRRVKLLEAFNALGVSRKRIETKMGRAADRLTAYDIGVLRVVYQSIRRGEVNVYDEFPTDAAGEVAEQLAPKKAEPKNGTETQEPREAGVVPAGDGAQSEPAGGETVAAPAGTKAKKSDPLTLPADPSPMDVTAFMGALAEKLDTLKDEVKVMDLHDSLSDALMRLDSVDKKAAKDADDMIRQRAEALVSA